MTEKKDSKYEFACKIFDNLDARTKGVTFADRNVDQIAEDIREQGMFHTSQVLRNSIIGGLEIKRPKGPAENVIIIGCACFGVAMPIRSYFLLLDELGISYTILRKEYCCGSPLMMRAVRTGEDREKADEYSREFVGKNMDQARELGAKRLVHLCVWCAYIGRRFYPDSDIEHVYALDILLPKLKEKKLSMPEETIAYYSGGQHRSWAYAPDRDFEFDWDSYRRALDDIEGLTVVDVPKY